MAYKYEPPRPSESPEAAAERRYTIREFLSMLGGSKKQQSGQPKSDPSVIKAIKSMKRPGR